jgi:ferredoxin
VRACPDAFFIESSKYGRARVVPGVDALALQDEVEVAMLTCPVDCIHWVRGGR